MIDTYDVIDTYVIKIKVVHTDQRIEHGSSSLATLFRLNVKERYGDNPHTCGQQR